MPFGCKKQMKIQLRQYDLLPQDFQITIVVTPLFLAGE